MEETKDPIPKKPRKRAYKKKSTPKTPDVFLAPKKKPKKKVSIKSRFLNFIHSIKGIFK